MADICGTCKYFQLGYRAGAERGYQWTTEDMPGVPLVIGRCAFDIPAGAPSANALWAWPYCHKDDWCGKWAAIPP